MTVATAPTTSARTDDGVTIAYRVRGDGPRAVLFMHGWAGSGAYFEQTLKRLDLTGLRLITVDMRGHGASDKPETSWTLDRVASDVLAVADHAGAERFVVAGFSMSAKFAQYLACIAPERESGQILIAGCPASEIPFPAETHQDWIDRAGDRAKLIELTRWFLTQPVEQEVLEAWADDAIKVPRVVLDESLKACLHTSFSDKLRDVRAPTLIVGGTHDAIFSPEVLRSAVQAPLKGARLVVLDCNHEVPLERPLELAGLIEAFLAGLGEAPR